MNGSFASKELATVDGLAYSASGTKDVVMTWTESAELTFTVLSPWEFAIS